MSTANLKSSCFLLRFNPVHKYAVSYSDIIKEARDPYCDKIRAVIASLPKLKLFSNVNVAAGVAIMMIKMVETNDVVHRPLSAC
jgi:hypothetical protein